MFLEIALSVTLLQISRTTANYDLWYQCAKFYKPQNYFDTLPNFNMPYLSQIPIPNNQDRILQIKNQKNQNKVPLQKIQPTPTLTTKVISVKTKYIYKNPICVKYSKKKKYCAPESVKKRQGADQLVTKEMFFARDGDGKLKNGEGDFRGHGFTLMQSDEQKEYFDDLDSSMEPRLSTNQHSKTPQLTPKQINDFLIEDRLDQLETILPHYTRKRKYQTSTLYITKVISNKRSMATLMVHNCIPQGYQVCPLKTKKRKSRLMQHSTDEEGEEE